MCKGKLDTCELAGGITRDMKINFAMAAVVVLLGTVVCAQQVCAQVPPPRDLESFVSYMQAHHRAPFDREGALMPKGETLKLQNFAPSARGLSLGS